MDGKHTGVSANYLGGENWRIFEIYLHNHYTVIYCPCHEGLFNFPPNICCYRRIQTISSYHDCLCVCVCVCVFKVDTNILSLIELGM